ncbi:MAG TPA: hypothetical protein VHH73_13415 [Verrucomicrobiae bacterium]|nr:hypothetical protein [Verrucomicrobiae bacterium]
MTLNDAQKQTVAGWVAEGLKLADIQKRLASELGLTLTYMDVRLLVDDLKLVPKDPEPVKVPETLAAPAPAAPPAGTPAPPKVGEPISPDAVGNVSIIVDQVTRPGALVSGKVTFSDGVKAEWYLDQMGRLGMAGPSKTYKPIPADIEAFQMQLEVELRKLGF